MKKSLVWAALIGTVFIIGSCKKDDPAPVSPIVGAWTRNGYEFTNLPTGFTKYWEGYQISSWGETGYTLTFRSDNTYSRSFLVGSAQYNLNDEGKYTLDGTSLKLSPSRPSDLDLIDLLDQNGYFAGTEFSIENDITDVRLTMSQVLTLGLPSDAAIDAAGGDANKLDSTAIKPVNVTVVYKFDKLKTN